MNAAWRIGRVGALAVALGVGMGISSNFGVAMAEVSEDAPVPSRDTASADHRGGVGGQRVPGRSANPGAGTGSSTYAVSAATLYRSGRAAAVTRWDAPSVPAGTSGPITDTAGGLTVADQTSPSLSAGDAVERPADISAAVTSGLGDSPIAEALSGLSDALSASGDSPETAAVLAKVSNPLAGGLPDLIAPAAAVAAAPVMTVAATVAGEAAAALTGLSSQGIVPQAPLLFTVLAWARKEFDRSVPRPAASVPAAAAAAKNLPPVLIGTVRWSTPSPDGTVSTNLAQVISDPNNDALSYKITIAPGKGTAVALAGGVVLYTPTAAARHSASTTGAKSAAKQDTFVVTVSDGKGGTLKVTLKPPISPKNAVPTAAPKLGATTISTGVVKGTIGATDADKDTLTYKVTTNPALGKLTAFNAKTGTFTYTPTPSALKAANAPRSTAPRTDTFTVSVSDGYGGTVNVPVKVTFSLTTAQKTTQYVADKRGTKVGTGECVALVQDYLSTMYGVTTNGNAVDYQNGGSAGKQLAASKKFEWHNAADRSFRDGDILVFKQDSKFNTAPQGHIEIYYQGKAFDQNSGWHPSYDPTAGGPDNVRKAAFSPLYPNGGKLPDGYLGYWRPL